MNIDSDLLLNDERYTILPEMFPKEIASLSAQIEKLNIDVHIQSLRVEIECPIPSWKLHKTLKTCKNCSNKMKLCPICRQTIERRVFNVELQDF